jgi:hypothetical protein
MVPPPWGGPDTFMLHFNQKVLITSTSESVEGPSHRSRGAFRPPTVEVCSLEEIGGNQTHVLLIQDLEGR